MSTEDKDPSTAKTTTPSNPAKDAINQHEKALAEEDGDGEANTEPVKKAAKVSATDTGEEKVLGGAKPQDREAADGGAAGDSVGD